MVKKNEVSKATRRSRPQEVSSRAPVPVGGLRKVFCPQAKARDPRMDGVSAGEFNAVKCAQAFGFVDEMRQSEMAALRRRAKDDEEAKTVLRKMENQDRQRQRMGELQEAKSVLRASEAKKVQETGKTPFFHTKQTIKTARLERQFEKLEKSGRVDQAIAKKRRHEDAKEKKAFVPRFRRSAGDS